MSKFSLHILSGALRYSILLCVFQMLTSLFLNRFLCCVLQSKKSCEDSIRCGWDLTLSPLAVNFEDRWWPLQTILIQIKPHKMWGFIWDPNCLTFRLYISKQNGWKQWFFLNFLKEINIWKNYPACKELKEILLHASSSVVLSCLAPTCSEWY